MRSAATLGTRPAGVKRVRSRLSRAASITARAGLALTLLGALSLLLSGAGSRWDWWDFRTGFVIFRWTLYSGLGAVVVALAGLVLALLARANNTALLSIGTLVLLAAVAVVPVSHLRAAGRVPPIHDITTDLDDPPRFVAVLPHRQGAPNTAEHGGAALAAHQRAGYPDLGPARFPAPPDRVFARALDVARGLGWEIVAAVPAEGRLEATNLIGIYAALSNESIDAVLARFGGQGFGAFKPALGELLVETLRPISERFNALRADTAALDAILTRGAEKAAALAAPTLEGAYKALGLAR